MSGRGSGRGRSSRSGNLSFFFSFFFFGERLANFLLEGKQLRSDSIELSALLFHAMSGPEVVESAHFPPHSELMYIFFLNCTSSLEPT